MADSAPAATLAAWDGHSAEALAARCGVPKVELLAEADSTMDVAHALAEQGAPTGTLVLADAQRAGRGRHGRRWSSPAGRGVWFTLLARPRDVESLDVLSLRVGLFAAESLDSLARERVGVKWPNDLMLRGGKLAGILSEARWAGESPTWVAIGVGVNVLPPADVPGAVGMPTGVQRVEVLTAVVAAVKAAVAYSGHLSTQELMRYENRDILTGVALVLPGAGTASGITSDGSLAIATRDGIEHFRAGTVQRATDQEPS